MVDSRVRRSHPEPSKVEAWLVGPWRRGEFRCVRPEAAPGEQWFELDRIEAAEDAIAAGQLPQPLVLLLAAPRPDWTTPAMLENLLARAPLTRTVVVAGSWCEGELRTGRASAGVHRVYWHQFPAWWRRSRSRIEQGLPPLWSYPPGMPVSESLYPPTETRSVLVSAPDYAVFQTLRDTLAPQGLSCEWQQSPTNRRPDSDHSPYTATAETYAAGIVDGGQLDARDSQRLKHARQILGAAAPVTLLLDYPRAEHLARSAEAGATTVLGKPYGLDDLIDSLQVTTPPRAK
ncbi:MAG: hypothetical protein AAGA92_03525 [Planctomycetota bacterium]